jgi:predicted kinase
VLVVMAGLPGAGKSALAAAVGRETGLPVLSVDPVEAAMWRAGVGGPDHPDVPTGIAAYAVVQALAAELLSAGHGVVVDAVNAVEPARTAWREVARDAGATLRWVEVVCSDPDLHRSRLEGRGERYAGFREPTWEQVRARRMEPWQDERLVVDSVRPLAELVPQVLASLAATDGEPSRVLPE